MRNLKIIIAGIVIGLMASCTADDMEDDCGCISRTVVTNTYNMVDGNGGTRPFSKTVYGSWTPSCGTTGIKDGPGNVKIETKCE